MFETLLVKPVFNLLEFIYAVVPGHDLGIAIILFTILIRLALWPIVHKQLHHAKVMRQLQPELKKIKKAAAGDRQKESRLQMELYKERGIKPLASIGTLIIQIPIFIALYQAILKLTNDPSSLLNFSYQSVRDLSWIKQLSTDLSKFDDTFLGLVDLSQRGLDNWYWPAIILALVSTVMQYYQSKLMMISNKDARKLSVILKDTAAGKETDQAEVTAAVSKIMLYFLPFVTFIFAIYVPSALSLYILTSSAVGYLQQRRVLGQDIEEMHQIADEKPLKKPKTVKTSKRDEPIKTVTTITTVSELKAASQATSAKPKTKSKSKSSAKKRRKR